MMTIESFWTRVRHLAKTQKKSLVELAKKIGVPRSTFFEWTKFGRLPDAFTTYSMAMILGVSIEYLITGKDGKNTVTGKFESQYQSELKIIKIMEKLQDELINLKETHYRGSENKQINGLK